MFSFQTPNQPTFHFKTPNSQFKTPLCFSCNPTCFHPPSLNRRNGAHRCFSPSNSSLNSSAIMGYFSCNAESAIATCDPYNWDPKRRLSKSRRNKPSKPFEVRSFSYQQLASSTDSFSADNFLGKGSHGTVYRAVLDDGKLTAAVKKPYPHHASVAISSNCTAATPAENEIEILSRVRHPRLVNLIGFCSDSNHRKLIVVEYMPNGSLYSLLHCAAKPPGWIRRIRFALQVAKAVHALHSASPPVIHRDIKSSNVLIDEKWKARLGDFGLALRGHVEDVRVKCTPPAGTLGYLDPGYLAPGDLSTKSDVFSFGILLLEIISGRNAIDVHYSPPSIVDWAVPLIKRGDISTICDHRIGSPVDQGVIENLAVLAARCVRSTAEKRPSMAEVVEGLKTVSGRVHAPPLWNRLRRRVERGEESPRPDAAENSNEEAVIVKKTGSRRSRKKSSVTSVEYESERIGWKRERVIRSRSIGSFGEIKMGGPDLVRRKQGVAVKIAAVKLNKSKSMGVLHRRNSRGFVFEIERETNSFESNLFVGLDEKCEKEMQEKPLVSI